MMKKILVAAATAAAVYGGALATAGTASANHVHFGFGFGFGSPYYCSPYSAFCGPGYYHRRHFYGGCRTVKVRHKKHFHFRRVCY